MQKILIKNKRAFHDFEILDRYTAGIVLLGHEVKSLKSGQGHFTGAYITTKQGELFIERFHIPLYKKATLDYYDPERTRKLLVRKAEFIKISSAQNTAGVTVIPLACGLENGKIKLEFALARGKKKYDKRETLRKKDAARRIAAAIKRHQ